MIFACGDCGERARIVGFRPADVVPRTFGMKRHIPLCMDCLKREPKAEPVRDQWSSPEREPGCDDDYPF